MGFWGSLVLARTAGASLLNFESIASRSEGLDSEDVRGPWRLGVFPGGELESAAPELHLELMEETGAPVLTAFVLDSDCAMIEAAGPATGFWRSCLARSAMRAYEDDSNDGDETFDALFLPPEQAAEAAAAWAAEAGYDVDRDLLRVLFETEPELFVHGLLQQFVDALGIPSIGADPDSEVSDGARRDAASVPAAARTVKRVNPVDRLVQEVAAPLLGSAGFVRDGREFAWTTTRGDLMEVVVDAKSVSSAHDFSFEASIALTPVAYQAWQDAGLACAFLHRPVQMPLSPPAELASEYSTSTAWEIAPPTSWEAAAVAWEACLKDQVLPAVARLADPGFVMDVLSDPRHQVLQNWERNGVFPAFGLGPTWQLDLVLSAAEQSHALDPQVLDWGAHWVQEQFHVGAGWRQERRKGSLARQVEQIVDQLTPTLAGRGFARRGRTFTRGNEYGDVLLLTVNPAFNAPAEHPGVVIELSVLPSLEMEHRQRPDARPRIGPEPQARDGWSYRRLPSPAPAEETAPFPSPDIWRVVPTEARPAPASAAVLVDALAGHLPDWQRLLDRDHLLDLLVPPARRIGHNTDASPRSYEELVRVAEQVERDEHLRIGAGSFVRCEIVLRAGKDPDQLVVALIDEALQDGMTARTQADFLTWARSRLAP
jgi:hypothetical protein